MPKQKESSKFIYYGDLDKKPVSNMLRCKVRGSIYRPQCVDCWHGGNGDDRAKTRAQCRQWNEIVEAKQDLKPIQKPKEPTDSTGGLMF